MFLGVVRRSTPCRDFDGKVLLELVSEKVEVTKLTTHQKIVNDILIHNTIKLGEWNNIYEGSSTLSCTEIIDSIIVSYALRMLSITS